MHGELLAALCAGCGRAMRWEGPMVSPGAQAEPVEADSRHPFDRLRGSASFAPPECPGCGAYALRPDIVFFGEMPYQMERIERAIARADLFVSIGTAGAVYPAAGFVRTAAYHGAQTLELNLDPSAGSVYFGATRQGPASVLVPAWVDEVLGA